MDRFFIPSALTDTGTDQDGNPIPLAQIYALYDTGYLAFDEHNGTQGSWFTRTEIRIPWIQMIRRWQSLLTQIRFIRRSIRRAERAHTGKVLLQLQLADLHRRAQIQLQTLLKYHSDEEETWEKTT